MTDHPTVHAQDAGVRDEDVENACAAYATAMGYYVPFHRGLSSESSDRMRNGMRAALAAAQPPPASPTQGVDGKTYSIYRQISTTTADPGDGTVRPSIEDVLSRGFHAMGWANPTLAAYEVIYGAAEGLCSQEGSLRTIVMDALVSIGNQDAFLDMPRYTRELVDKAIEELAGVAEQSGAGAPETSVRCGAPAATSQMGAEDARRLANKVQEYIAQNDPFGDVFSQHDLQDIYIGLVAGPPTASRSPAEISKPFFGAECSKYPNCTGGCGLGCTKEHAPAETSSQKSAPAVAAPQNIAERLPSSDAADPGADTLPAERKGAIIAWDCASDEYREHTYKQMAAEIQQLRSDIEKLKDPVAVHINMLRGGIAKPSLANIKHLYPEIRDDLDRAAAQVEGVLPSANGYGCVKPDTDRQVFFYEQDFYVLSNFSAFTLNWQGWRFDTSEAAYHWEKFAHMNEVGIVGGHECHPCYLIRRAASAHAAFKIAEANKEARRPDWDDVKVGIMREILRAKANQHEYVRRKLLATGDRELIEDSWRDSFWGWGPDRDGRNMLGKLWMEVRAELRGVPHPSTVQCTTEDQP